MATIHKLALDEIPAGKPGEDYSGKRPLPEGITKRRVLEDVVKIAGPSFVELMLTQLTSMFDLMMVGQLGSWAITAVGLTNQPKFLLMTLVMSLNVGATAIIARYKGAGHRDKANLAMKHAMLVTLCLAVVLSTIGYIYARPLIIFLGSNDPLSLDAGVTYFRIQMAGFTFMLLTSSITASLRGAGDSKTAMYYNVTANVVNVIGNYLLINGHFGFPRMEVAGASLATVIGQTVAFVMALRAVTKKGGYLHLKLKEKFTFSKEIMSNIVTIGLPSMIEQLFMRVGMIIYAKTVANLGTVAFATHNVCMNIQAMSFMLGQAFAVSSTSLVGQSLGKRRPDMAKHYTSFTSSIGVILSIVLGVIFFLFGGQVVALYSNETEVIEVGSKILMFLAFIQPFQASQFIIAGSLRGAGDTKATAAVIFVTTLLIRPFLAIFLINYFNLGLYGAWIALVTDQLIRSALIWARYASGKWQLLKLKGE